MELSDVCVFSPFGLVNKSDPRSMSELGSHCVIARSLRVIARVHTIAALMHPFETYLVAAEKYIFH